MEGGVSRQAGSKSKEKASYNLRAGGQGHKSNEPVLRGREEAVRPLPALLLPAPWEYQALMIASAFL